jgi:hypothetical protein
MNPQLNQWHRLWLVVLCATPALWADVCSGLPGGPRDGWNYFPDNRVEGQTAAVFRLQPKRGGPAFRITVTTLATSFGDANPVPAGGIEVARCQDGKRLQQFPLTAWQLINFGLSFSADDINFDGYLDLSVLTEFAAGWKARVYWVYDPALQRFVKNELTHALEDDLKGHIVDIDSTRHLISAGLSVAVNACAGGEPDVYTVKDNRLILVHTVEIKSYANGRCTKKVLDIAGATLRVTSETRVDSQGNPVGPNDIPPPVEPPVVKLLPVTQPPKAPGALLFEHPLDSSQGGLYSTGQGRGQVGADQSSSRIEEPSPVSAGTATAIARAARGTRRPSKSRSSPIRMGYPAANRSPLPRCRPGSTPRHPLWGIPSATTSRFSFTASISPHHSRSHPASAPGS